jgi:hypothetical protein
LQNALESSMEEKSEEPVEKLRHDELIPLGRALYALAECVTHRRLRKPDAIAARVSAVSYHASAVQASHGRVPSRVLPEPVRNALLDRKLDVAVARTLREIFEGLPDMPPGAPPRFPRFLRRAA